VLKDTFEGLGDDPAGFEGLDPDEGQRDSLGDR
jgi:hypothetical protein